MLLLVDGSIQLGLPGRQVNRGLVTYKWLLIIIRILLIWLSFIYKVDRYLFKYSPLILSKWINCWQLSLHLCRLVHYIKKKQRGDKEEGQVLVKATSLVIFADTHHAACLLLVTIFAYCMLLLLPPRCVALCVCYYLCHENHGTF